MMILEGAHMLCRECGRHVNLLLDHIIFQVSKHLWPAAPR